MYTAEPVDETASWILDPEYNIIATVNPSQVDGLLSHLNRS